MTLLKAGDKCPDFELQQQDEKVVKLSDFKGKKLLIFFYPKANTPGCSKQACAVTSAKAELEALGCAAIGVSADTPKKQKNFEVKKELGIPLLCDTEKELCNAFGVWQQKKMAGREYMGIVRSSFLIDEDGVISEAWYKVKPDATVPLALEFLNA